MIGYRATFRPKIEHDSDFLRYDLEAENSDDAISKAYRYLRDRGIEHRFSEVMVEEIPKGPTNIGIKFAYEEGKRGIYYNYIVIRANDEADAEAFYNKTLLGKRFYQPWPAKIDENGNCVYGRVAETYFAACPGFDLDATV